VPAYDLTHPIRTGMQVYPGDPAVAVEPHADIDSDGYRVSALELGTHAGTHVDAPCHVEPGGKSLADFPVEAFRFDAVRVDLRGVGARDPIRRAELSDAVDAAVDAAVDSDDAFTDPDMLVLRTGWDEHWGTPRYFDHPYVTGEAAAWCAERGYHLGLDALSPDPTPTENAAADEPAGVPAHRALFAAERLIVENLTGLDALPARFELCAYPLSLDADGSPVRAVAVVE
jgi:kynurenine formamidase